MNGGKVQQKKIEEPKAFANKSEPAEQKPDSKLSLAKSVSLAFSGATGVGIMLVLISHFLGAFDLFFAILGAFAAWVLLVALFYSYFYYKDAGSL